MHKYQGCDAFIATYVSGNFPNIKYVPGLRIEAIPKRTKKYDLDSFLWLIKNAKRIDVLNIYHMVMRTVMQAFLFRVFNRKGKIYFKCDGCPTKNSGKSAKSKFRSIIKTILGGWLVRNADLVSTEFQENVEVLNREWGIKAVCVPNPVNPNEVRDFRPFSERSSTIFTVGRLGTKQKATEILLEAFVKIADQIPDWTLKLAGPFAENIHIADDFYKAHPELRERVIFTGNITDRDEMAELYRDAKTFAFPSRHESFGIALTEALAHGCFPVVSNIPASERLTQNFKYALASEVDDIDGMAKNLLYACTHESEIESLARQGRDHILEHCRLERISHVIAQGLR